MRDYYKALHSTDTAQQAIGRLHYATGYLADALSGYQDVLTALSEGNDLDAVVMEKRAGNALHSALSFLEGYRKLASENDSVVHRTTISTTHIAKGECGEPSRCALALGLAEMFDVSPDRVSVDGKGASIHNGLGFESIGFELSERLQEWVSWFDCGKRVKTIQMVAKRVEGLACDYLLDME